MPKTLRERFIEALQARGETEVKRLTGCIVYTRQQGGFYFLGSSGSIRVGTNRTTSIPVSNRFKGELLGVPK